MFYRSITEALTTLAKKFAVITITGPRQSGKTTLAKNIFKNHQYINLEQPQLRMFAQNDPEGFFKQYSGNVIIDEVQYAPELFSYIQVRVDENKIPGQFILTGSQNFALSEKISQSLAGRTVISTLLPFSIAELNALPELNELLFKGLYPPIYDMDIDPIHWYPSYINTYLERDVRNILNIESLSDFQKFISICAARAGQLINLTAISNEVGVSHVTVKKWLSILESSYIMFSLKPYFKNFNKRLVKSPKLFFHDTGLLCSLLGITTKEQLQNHYMKGAIFENFIISEIHKLYYNKLIPPKIYFWRDHVGNEADCVIDNGDSLSVIEIKSGETFKESFLKSTEYFSKLKTDVPINYKVIYGGDYSQTRTNSEILSWKELNKVMP